MNSAYYASFLVQAAGAVLTAGIFRALGRSYFRRFLSDWAWSWAALALSALASGVAAMVATSFTAAHPVRLLLAAIGSVAGYVQIVYLLFGSAGVVGHGFSRKDRKRWLLIAAAVGIAVLVPFALDPHPNTARLFIRVGIREGVVAAAFLLSAVGVFRRRARNSGKLGPRVACASIGAYGLVELYGLFALTMDSFTSVRVPETTTTGFASLLFGTTAALGVVVWLLEDERRVAREYAAQAEELALRDPLTGLATRKRFMSHVRLAISRARRDNHYVAVFFLDLDRFKLINDSLGHATGDRLLHAIGLRLRATLREEDVVARMGGDEFTILASVVRNPAEVAQMARRIQGAIREPVHVDGRELFVSTSIGISLFPDDGETVDVLLRNADLAMYQAKSEGPDLFRMYAPAMNAEAHEQLAVESGLHHAVRDGQLELHFQPIVDLTGMPRATEALLRWQHPTLGVLYPSRFMATAETTGLITELGAWVLDEACRTLARLRDGAPELRMAINMSARQLREPQLIATLQQAVARHGLTMSALEFEIPESVVAQSDDHISRTVARIRELGGRVTIDGFGAGSASLHQLWTFPCDGVKTARVLLSDGAAAGREGTPLGLAAALARARNVELVVAGVERTDQLEVVRSVGADAWQGRLFGEPAAVRRPTESSAPITDN